MTNYLSCLFQNEYRLIVGFKAEEVKEGEEFKVDWKLVERAVKEKYAGLKLIYSRSDPHAGHLAFSNLRLKSELIDELVANKIEI